MIRNKSGQTLHVKAFNSAGAVTGNAANITCLISVDGSARVATSDVNPTEIGATGEYEFTLTQAETAGHELSFIPVSATPGVQVFGMPNNLIYTVDPYPRLTISQQIIESMVDQETGEIPTVRRGTQWSSTTKVGSITGATAIYYGLKASDVEDDEAMLIVRLPLNESGGIDGIVRISGGTVIESGVEVTDAHIVMTYDAVEDENTFVMTSSGEASAVIEPTTQIVESNRPGFTRKIEQNGYLSEWKIVGEKDEVLSSSYLKVLPDIVRATS